MVKISVFIPPLISFVDQQQEETRCCAIPSQNNTSYRLYVQWGLYTIFECIYDVQSHNLYHVLWIDMIHPVDPSSRGNKVLNIHEKRKLKSKHGDCTYKIKDWTPKHRKSTTQYKFEF